MTGVDAAATKSAAASDAAAAPAPGVRLPGRGDLDARDRGVSHPAVARSRALWNSAARADEASRVCF